jgi:hypothetical protein
MLPPNSHRKTEMPQELDEVEGPEELIEEDLDELADDDDLIADDALAVPDEDDDAELAAVEEVDEVEDIPEVAAKVATKPGAAAEESEDDDEEEPDDEDVEASLDTILKERLVVEEVVEDDEDTPEPEDRGGEGVERVLPKQPGEFVCRSCFLVKHPNQLADRKKMLCRDCV